MTPDIEWLLIDSDNLPKGEVLAGNFKEKTFGYREVLLGGLYKGAQGFVRCENANEILENCTHYIDIHNNYPESI